jgi:hypothetical protein
MRAEAVQLSGRRRAAVWLLIVLATVIAFISVLTTWVNRQMLDNNAWKNASEEVIQDPEVRDALSVFLVNELYSSVDVPAALRERLPRDAKPLAAPVAAGLREPATNAVDFMLSRPRIQNRWISASAAAHQRLVNVLENKTGYGIATGNGVVTLDLGDLVTQLGTEIGIPASALAKVPPQTGEVVLMRSSELSLAQQGVQVVRVLSVWLLVLVLVMYAAAVCIARGRRRETIRTIAWAFVLLGVLLLAVRKIAGSYVVDALASPAYHVTGHHVWLIATSILGQIAWATVWYGLVALAGVTLAGPTRAARAVRRLVAPVLNNHQGYAWSGFALVMLLLVLWGGTHALRTWWGVLLLGALLAAGLVALRRQTLSEAAVSAGLAPSFDPSRLTAKVRKAVGGGGRSPGEEIARLQALRETGSITDEEFERGKRLALG